MTHNFFAFSNKNDLVNSIVEVKVKFSQKLTQRKCFQKQSLVKAEKSIANKLKRTHPMKSRLHHVHPESRLRA
jgi:thiamine kinase-like enzyme